jgi:hypothetical protein
MSTGEDPRRGQRPARLQVGFEPLTPATRFGVPATQESRGALPSFRYTAATARRGSQHTGALLARPVDELPLDEQKQ